MDSVLVLGNYRPSLTVVRSLAKSGYRVIVGSRLGRSLVDLSRYSQGIWEHPSIDEGVPFFEALLKFLRSRPDISFVFPVLQSTVVFTSERYKLFPPGATLVTSTPRLIHECLDKVRMYDHAESIGIPVEPYATVSSDIELLNAAGGIGYPCIVRPVGSGPERLPGGKKAIIVYSPREMEEGVLPWPSGHSALLIQRFSPGARHGIYFAAAAGKVLGRVEVVSERTDMPDGTGFAVEGISVEPNPVLTKYLVDLVAKLEYTGIGAVQFLRRSEDQFHFLELNPRLGGNSAIAVRCGLDLPVLACELAAGRQPSNTEQLRTYPAGVRYAWTFGDIQGLRRARARREISLVECWHGYLRALRSGLTADVHLTWSVRDPLPTLATYAYWEPTGLGRRLLNASGVRTFDIA